MVEIYRNREPHSRLTLSKQEIAKCQQTLLGIEKNDEDVQEYLNFHLQSINHSPSEITGISSTFKTLAASIASFNDMRRWKKTAFFMSGKHLNDLLKNNHSYYVPQKFNPESQMSEEELKIMYNLTYRGMKRNGEYTMPIEELYAGLVTIADLSENYISRLITEK